MLLLKIETESLPGEYRSIHLIENALVMERNPVRYLLNEPFTTEGMPEADLILRLSRDQQVQLGTSLLMYALDFNEPDQARLREAVEKWLDR